MSSSLQGFVLKNIRIHGDHECKMKVLECPFIPSHLTFKKFQISLNQSPNNQTINQIYLFIYNIPKFRILGCYTLLATLRYQSKVLIQILNTRDELGFEMRWC